MSRAGQVADPSDAVLVEQREHALWITLNRPSAFNSLTPAMVSGLDAALERAEADRVIRSVVITGAGPAFCAGADLKEAQAGSDAEGGAEATMRFVEAILAVTRHIEGISKPVIAAVNGIALAGGLELVLACDLVIAAEDARFGDAHANFGLLPGAGSSVRLPARIGVNRAKYLLFTGEFVSARRMEAWGLVNEVADPEFLLQVTRTLAGRIATRSPLGIGRMKRLVQDGIDLTFDDALRAEQAMSRLHATSRDRLEGMTAFTEKRTPHFVGE